MAAGRYNITIEQGATFNMDFTIKTDSSNWNLTSYTARMQIRASAYSDVYVISLTDTDGITLGGSAGTVSILISAEDTAEIAAGKYVYDFELESAGGEVWRVLEGKCTVKAEVTK